MFGYICGKFLYWNPTSSTFLPNIWAQPVWSVRSFIFRIKVNLKDLYDGAGVNGRKHLNLFSAVFEKWWEKILLFRGKQWKRLSFFVVFLRRSHLHHRRFEYKPFVLFCFSENTIRSSWRHTFLELAYCVCFHRVQEYYLHNSSHTDGP